MVGTEHLTRRQKSVGIQETIDHFHEDWNLNSTYQVLRRYPETTKQIEDYLDAEGFRKLTYFENGGSSILFSTPHDQLVRVCVDWHNKAPNIPEILQPLPEPSRKFLVKGEQHKGKPLHIEVSVYPKILANPDEIRLEHILDLGERLLRRGYEFHDPQRRNVGLLPDGTPIIIDAGAVRPLKKDRVKEAIIKTLKFVLGYQDSPPAVPTEEHFKQHEFYPQTPQGVASDETLARIEAEHEDGASYTQMIRCEGLYTKDLMSRLGRAAESHNAKQDGSPLSAHLHTTDAVKQR